MKVARFFAVLFLLLFVCFSPSVLFAYDNSKEYISEFTPDTGNMNERPADRNFAGSFIVKAKSTNVNDYKVDGVAKKINVAVYVSWQNNGSFSRVYTSSYTPVSGSSVVSSKTFNFTCSNPETWSKPIRVIIVAQYNATPTDSPQTSYSGRGHIIDQLVETPTPLANVSLGSGSTAYEGLKSFTGSTGEVDPVTGKVKLLMTVLVTIFQNPLGGSYDPTPEGIGVFADLTGGSNPTTRVYGETKLAGAYWDSIGRPSLPFDLPFYGEWLIDNDNYPGEIVGGTAMAWGAVPVLGSNTTWGQQNRVVWYLPPKKVVFQVKENLVPNWKEVNGEKIYEIYDGQSFGASASVLLRTMQIPSRVGGFEWNWGNGTATDTSHKIAGKLHSDKTYQYNLPNNDNTTDHIYTGYCNVHYQNSKNNSSDLRYPFKVKVKHLPAIYPKSSITVKRIASGGTASTLIKEDLNYSFTGTGKGSRLITLEGYESNYNYYYKITDPSAIPTELTKDANSKEAPSINHKFKYIAEGSTEDPWKKVSLYIHYREGEMVNGKLVDHGWKDKLLASREFILGAQDELNGNDYQKLVFKVTPASATKTIVTSNTFTETYPNKPNYKPDYKDYQCIIGTITPAIQKVTMTFKADAEIFYGGRFENDKNDDYDSTKTDKDLDRWNGVATGSIYYRWRVLTPDGEDAFEKGYATVSDSEYYLISDFNTEPYPLTDSYNKPLVIGTNRVKYSPSVSLPSGVEALTILSQDGSIRNATEKEFPTGIKPITITFNTPYGTTVNPNRFYRVFIEAKYQDIKWGSNWTYVGFTDETKGNSAQSGKMRWSKPTPRQRYIAYYPCKIFNKSTSNKYQINTSATNSLSSNTLTNSYYATNNDFGFYKNSNSLNDLLSMYGREGTSDYNKDTVADASLGYLVKINDEIPAKVSVRDLGPVLKDKAFTGDPFNPSNAYQSISISVEDNNPDVIASYAEIIYDRFNESEYNMEPMISAICDLDLSKDSKNKYVSRSNGKFDITRKSLSNAAKTIFDSRNLKGKLSSKEKSFGYPFTITSLINYINNKDNQIDYSSFVALYSNDEERLPYSFSTSMLKPKYNGVDNDKYKGKEGKFFYKAKAYIDDGIKHYIETEEKSFEVLDNDIPNIKITLVNPETGNSSVYELTDGFKDPQSSTNPLVKLTKKLTIGTGTPKIKNIDEIFTNKELKVDMGDMGVFKATANERFICNIELLDNVVPTNIKNGCASYTIYAKTNKDATNGENNFTGLHPTLRKYQANDGKYYGKSANPLQFFLTTSGNTTLTVTVKDQATSFKNGNVYSNNIENKIIFTIPIIVEKQKDAIIRVLDQRHEKE